MSNQLSDANIAWLAHQVGWSKPNDVIAVAVALAESSGDFSAVNKKVPTVVGGWQVNYAAHKDIVSNINDLYQPAKNAVAAKAVFDSSGWGAWTTYNNGAYRQYIGRAQVAVQNPKPPSFKQLTGVGGHGPSLAIDDSGVVKATDPIISGIGSTVTAIPDFLALLSNSKTWFRVAEIIGGIVAIILGFYLAAKGQLK